MSAGPVTLIPLPGLPEVGAGDDLARLLSDALREAGGLRDGDLLVVSSKVVSKSLGLRHADRDAAVREHTVRVVAERATPNGTTRVVQALAGPVMAAAGVDASNTGAEAGALLLPADPDAAARDLHGVLSRRLPGTRFGLVLSDTAGRPWRAGQVDFALGAHGVAVLDDLRGGTDADGRPLAVTARAVGDEVAAAADLVKGKSARVAAALVRGLGTLVRADGAGAAEGAAALLRTGPGDWFSLGHREAVRAALGAAPGSEAARVVGLPSTGPEPVAARIDRAVRLALLGHPGTTVRGDAEAGLLVSAADPVLVGRVAARLEVALAGEDVDVRVAAAPSH